MIGGPSDVVVETNIVRAAPVATARRTGRAQRRGRDRCRAPCRCADPTPWPLQPEPRAAARRRVARTRRAARRRHLADAARSPPPPPRRPFPTFARCAPPTRSPASPTNSRRADAEPASRGRGAPRRAAERQVQPLRPAAPTPPRRSHRGAADPAADQSLAEMAQRSKPRCAARRRGKVAAETQRVTATVDVKRRRPPKGAAPSRSRSSSNLEQEMASLLSRPGKT